MPSKAQIDRKKQKRERKARFFDSYIMKALGLGVVITAFIWVVFGLCVAAGSSFSTQVYDFAEDLTLMLIAAIFSAAGIKAETANLSQ